VVDGSTVIEGTGHRDAGWGRARWFAMNVSTAAVMVAAVAACNGRDPRAAPAKAQAPIAMIDAAPAAAGRRVVGSTAPPGAAAGDLPGPRPV
jgi:hypothetical protein